MAVDTLVGGWEERSPQSRDVGRRWIQTHQLQVTLKAERPLAVDERETQQTLG